eukprot:1409940-Rhodomonas_salina.3
MAARNSTALSMHGTSFKFKLAFPAEDQVLISVVPTLAEDVHVSWERHTLCPYRTSHSSKAFGDRTGCEIAPRSGMSGVSHRHHVASVEDNGGDATQAVVDADDIEIEEDLEHNYNGGEGEKKILHTLASPCSPAVRFARPGISSRTSKHDSATLTSKAYAPARARL